MRAHINNVIIIFIRYERWSNCGTLVFELAAEQQRYGARLRGIGFALVDFLEGSHYG